jgi:hypothetical protein
MMLRRISITSQQVFHKKVHNTIKIKPNLYVLNNVSSKIMPRTITTTSKINTNVPLKRALREEVPDVNHIIRKYVQEFTNKNEELENKLCNDLLNNINYGNMCIEIGKLMDIYEIQPYELLYAVYNVMHDINSIVNMNSFTLNDAKRILIEEHNYVEYLYGKPIKIFFRRNKGENQYIFINKYEKDSNVIYKCIVWLLLNKIR